MAESDLKGMPQHTPGGTSPWPLPSPASPAPPPFLPPPGLYLSLTHTRTWLLGLLLRVRVGDVLVALLAGLLTARLLTAPLRREGGGLGVLVLVVLLGARPASAGAAS